MNNIENENTYKKFQQIPSGTSTPNNLVVSSRKSIHHNNSVSPITRTDGNNAPSPPLPREWFSKKQERSKSEVHSDSNQSENSSTDCDENDTPKSYTYESSSKSSYILNNSNRKNLLGKAAQCGVSRSDQRVLNESNSNIMYGCISIAALSALLAVCYISVIPSENAVVTTDTITIKEMKDYFPRQSENTWNALESGIGEVKSFNKPSVFLLLYEDEAEETLNYMLKSISKYAVCVVKENCDLEPIILTRAILGTEKARADYGYVIEKYKPELEKKSVMIVKNFDKIPGEVAQAFHSMCDEYTPLVPRAVFFFTIRIEHLHESEKRDLQMVEEVLKNNWSVLDDDIFYPLFTRISNMVLRIVPENS